jgi:hypothetical protein
VAAFGQWLLVVVFLAAAGAKWEDNSAFFRVLVAIPWVSVPRARTLSRVIPASEGAAAATLIVAPRVGAFAALALLVSFTGVVVSELLAGRRFECGCFGGGTAGTAGPLTVVRNAVLGLLAIAVLVWPPGGGTAAALAGAGAAFLLLLFESGSAAISAARDT